MIKFDLDELLLKNMIVSEEEYNYIIGRGLAGINGFLAKKNVPCHISKDDKISIVHDALIRFAEYFDVSKDVKPSSFFYHVLKGCLIRTNTNAQKRDNSEVLTEDNVLFAEIEGDFDGIK